MTFSVLALGTGCMAHYSLIVDTEGGFDLWTCCYRVFRISISIYSVDLTSKI